MPGLDVLRVLCLLDLPRALQGTLHARRTPPGGAAARRRDLAAGDCKQGLGTWPHCLSSTNGSARPLCSHNHVLPEQRSL